MLNSFGNQALPFVYIIGIDLFASFFISFIFNVFYMFYLESKFAGLRVKAATSFPKTQILTKEMIDAEMVRINPEYGYLIQGFLPRIFKTFIVTFIVLLVASYLVFFPL